MRRKHFEIRNAILASLEKYPKPAHEIAGDTKLALVTVQKHLEYLQSLGVVGTSDFRRRDKKPCWIMRR